MIQFAGQVALAGSVGVYCLGSVLVDKIYSQVHFIKPTSNLANKVAQVAGLIFIGICAGAISSLPAWALFHFCIGKAAFIPVVLNVALGIIHGGFYGSQAVVCKDKPMPFLALFG